jgi:16S rRNA (cytidine1402-2'-O)-methyltransferase
MATGTLYLIPSPLAPQTERLVLPPQALQVLPQLQHFLAEDVRTARRFLSALGIYPSIEALHFSVLNKDTPAGLLPQLMLPLTRGAPMGLLSEAGCPGIADPGAQAVAFAHLNGVRVVPLVGPSAILLALMASGLNGQQFAFHGYLPVEARALSDKLLALETESRKKNQTQIFIETPYRNQSLFNHLLKTLHPTTLLCVAMDITGATEQIATKTVASWRQTPFSWRKSPCVFLFLRP